MRIAFLSDTHDRVDVIKRIFKEISSSGIDTVFHLGDIVAPFVVRFIKEEYGGKLYIVYGNNDGDRLLLKERFEEIGAVIKPPPLEVEIGGRRIIAMHEPLSVEALTKSGSFDVVAFGHTHNFVLNKIGDTLLLNPGEACGYLSGKNTYIIVDLETLDGEKREL
jgi:hypothetical protein